MSLPPNIVHSREIEQRLGLAPDWIERRTGIRARRIASEHERLDAHATHAAAEALAVAGIDGKDVDLVLVATTTADEVMPNTAPLVATSLGATDAGAFDIGAACTGFLSALATGVAMIDAGRAGCVVVIGADFMSRDHRSAGSGHRRRLRRRSRRDRAGSHRGVDPNRTGGARLQGRRYGHHPRTA